MTKTVKDAAGLMNVIGGYDKNDPTSVDVPVDNYLDFNGDVKDLVIGVNEDYFFNQVDSDIEKLVRQSIQSLVRSEEHTSELQSRGHLVCRLLLEKKKKEERGIRSRP